jgi:hypothetical protein
VGSGFDDRVYWRFFTITVDYNSSHIEPLLNDVCLTNLYEESLTNFGLISTTRIESESESESEPYVTTDGQSASLSWNKAPIWGLRPDFYYCQTVAGLLMWSALYDERMGLLFTNAAGPRQRSHFQVRVPWDSRPYFAVSDSRLPFLSPPTTRRATVEVFDPASIWECLVLEFTNALPFITATRPE